MESDGTVSEKWHLDPEDDLTAFLSSTPNTCPRWKPPSGSFSGAVQGWPRPKSCIQADELIERVALARENLIAGCSRDSASTCFVPIWRRSVAHGWEQVPEAFALLAAQDERELIERTNESCNGNGILPSGIPRVFLTALPNRRAQPVVRTRKGNCLSLIRLLRDLPDLGEVYPSHRKHSQKRLGFHYLAHTPLILYRSHARPMAFIHGGKATRDGNLLYWATEYQGAVEAMCLSPLRTLTR